MRNHRLQITLPPDFGVRKSKLRPLQQFIDERRTRAVIVAGQRQVEREMFGTARIEAITLFESRLSSTGPTYVPLLRTSLWPGEPA